MLAQQAETQPVNSFTIEDIQNLLEATTVERYWRRPQWDHDQKVNETIAEGLQQLQQAQENLNPEQRQKADCHLTAGIQALKALGIIEPGHPAKPEQQDNFELAWENIEQARIALCTTAYERLHSLGF